MPYNRNQTEMEMPAKQWQVMEIGEKVDSLNLKLDEINNNVKVVVTRVELEKLRAEIDEDINMKIEVAEAKTLKLVIAAIVAAVVNIGLLITASLMDVLK